MVGLIIIPFNLNFIRVNPVFNPIPFFIFFIFLPLIFVLKVQRTYPLLLYCFWPQSGAAGLQKINFIQTPDLYLVLKKGLLIKSRFEETRGLLVDCLLDNMRR